MNNQPNYKTSQVTEDVNYWFLYRTFVVIHYFESIWLFERKSCRKIDPDEDANFGRLSANNNV